MGAWGYCFLSNDDIQDELLYFNNLSNPAQVSYFNQLRIKTKTEAETFKVAEDNLPLEYNEEEYLDLITNLVDPDQDTSNRELFLGFIQNFIGNKQYQLLTSDVLEEALNYLNQMAHKNLLKRYNKPEHRFNEIFKLRSQILKLV